MYTLLVGFDLGFLIDMLCPIIFDCISVSLTKRRAGECLSEIVRIPGNTVFVAFADNATIGIGDCLL